MRASYPAGPIRRLPSPLPHATRLGRWLRGTFPVWRLSTRPAGEDRGRVPTIADDAASAADFADSTRSAKSRGSSPGAPAQVRRDVPDALGFVGGADLVPERLELPGSTLKDDA